MTKAYDQLKKKPRTGFRGQLPPQERAELRRIKVTGSHGRGRKGGPGQIETVYYLEGDEARAARVFVEENRDQLEKIDFSQQNPIAESLSQDVYDLVLHHLGERRRKIFPTLVVEKRRDGTIWLIDRERYEDRPGRRYTLSDSHVAKIPPSLDLRELFDSADDLISESDVRAWPIEGDPRQVLNYFRSADSFLCEPVTVDTNELAIRKQ